MKPIVFMGSALDDLRAFPTEARRAAGHQLDRVQRGYEPIDWKPMRTIGPGVQEIRIKTVAGAHRVVYVAKFADAVYVLHCFEKRGQATSRPDLEMATRRYGDIEKAMRR